MKNNKKLIAIVVAIVLALIGLIVFIMKDSNEANSTQNQSGQLVISKVLTYKRKRMAS